MESTLTITDVLQLTEIVSQSVEFEMNIKTYLKILDLENDKGKVPQIQNKINGVRVHFNNSLHPNYIKLNSKFNTYPKKSLNILLK